MTKEIELETVLKMHPLERPLDLAGASVVATFESREHLMEHWKYGIAPLLHSMSKHDKHHSWKAGRTYPLPTTLIVRIMDGNEERVISGWDFEIEQVESLCNMVGKDNVKVIMG